MFTICMCPLFCLCHVLRNVPLLAGVQFVFLQPVAAMFACESVRGGPHTLSSPSKSQQGTVYTRAWGARFSLPEGGGVVNRAPKKLREKGSLN